MMLTARKIAATRPTTGKTTGRPIIRVNSKGDGYVNEDNSGKGNIFPTTQKAFFSSPTTDAAAREGLGGATGGAVLAAALGVVGLATAAVLSTGSGETLSQVQAGDVESLSAIAARIAASL